MPIWTPWVKKIPLKGCLVNINTASFKMAGSMGLLGNPLTHYTVAYVVGLNYKHTVTDVIEFNHKLMDCKLWEHISKCKIKVKATKYSIH